MVRERRQHGTGDDSHDDAPIEERHEEDGEDGEREDDDGDQEDGGDQDNDDASSGERQISYHFAVALNLAQLHSDQVIKHTSIDSALEAVGGNTKQSKNWKTRYNWPRRSRDFSRNVNVNNLTLRISADSTRISVSGDRKKSPL